RRTDPPAAQYRLRSLWLCGDGSPYGKAGQPCGEGRRGRRRAGHAQGGGTERGAAEAHQTLWPTLGPAIPQRVPQMTCPVCGRELERCPVSFMGLPAYFECACGKMGYCVHVTAQKLEEAQLQEQLARMIPVLRERGPI